MSENLGPTSASAQKRRRFSSPVKWHDFPNSDNCGPILVAREMRNAVRRTGVCREMQRDQTLPEFKIARAVCREIMRKESEKRKCRLKSHASFSSKSAARQGLRCKSPPWGLCWMTWLRGQARNPSWGLRSCVDLIQSIKVRTSGFEDKRTSKNRGTLTATHVAKEA